MITRVIRQGNKYYSYRTWNVVKGLTYCDFVLIFCQFDFIMNALLSMNMVVTLLVAIVLDNTVPGSQQERGVYLWSTSEDLSADPSSLDDYSLPKKVSRVFRWAKCLDA